MQGGGIAGLLEDDEEEAAEDEDEDDLVLIDGKPFKKVRIAGEEEVYLMDPQGRIYDSNMELVGEADDDDV